MESKDTKHFGLGPLNLQFFADDGADDGSAGDEGNGNQNAGNGNQSQQQNSGEGTKTFTQEEVNRIGATEKNQGKNSILKLFGCSDEETAKAQAEEFKKWQEQNKTAAEKLADTEKQLKAEAKASEKRAEAAENKLSALQSGVNADSIDDALAIALPKVTAEKSLEKVLEEMKKESKYSGFFGTSSSAGTGSSTNHSGGSGGKDNIGERLAKSKLAGKPQKSQFFKN